MTSVKKPFLLILDNSFIFHPLILSLSLSHVFGSERKFVAGSLSKRWGAVRRDMMSERERTWMKKSEWAKRTNVLVHHMRWFYTFPPCSAVSWSERNREYVKISYQVGKIGKVVKWAAKTTKKKIKKEERLVFRWLVTDAVSKRLGIEA